MIQMEKAKEEMINDLRNKNNGTLDSIDESNSKKRNRLYQIRGS
jgi:hypothetical protein